MNHPLNQQEKCKHPHWKSNEQGIFCARCGYSPHQEGWAERFDGRFTPDWWMGFGTTEDINKLGIGGIKSFIRQELTALHKADCERFRGMIGEDEEISQWDLEVNDLSELGKENRNRLRAKLRTVLSKMEEEK